MTDNPDDRIHRPSPGGVKRPCASARQDGQPCRALAATGSARCLAHGPGHLERSSRGGKRTGERVQAAIAEHAARLSGISGDDLKDRASIRNLLAHAIKAGIEGKLPSSRVAVVSTLLNTAIRLLSVSDEPAQPAPSAPTKVEFELKPFARPGGDVERKDAVVASTTFSPTPRSFRCPGRDGECAAPLAAGTEVCWRCGSRLTWKSGA